MKKDVICVVSIRVLKNLLYYRIIKCSMNLNQLRMSNIKKYKKMVYGMNLNNQMIIIDGEIVTQEISYII